MRYNYYIYTEDRFSTRTHTQNLCTQHRIVVINVLLSPVSIFVLNSISVYESHNAHGPSI